MSKNNNDFVALFGSSDISQIEEKIDAIMAIKLGELRAKKFNQSLLSPPTGSNGSTAISRSSISLADGREASAISAVSGQVRGIDNNEDIVALSKIRASFDAIRLVEKLPILSKDQQVIDVVPENGELRIGFSQKKKKEFNHRFDKILSDKQLTTLQEMSVQRGKNINSLCMSMFNKDLKKLSSAEAHELIQHLKDPKKQ